ncbi:serine/threonine-protein kinase [Trichocoleus sp. DQ-U1]|uniref:serine/threonine-protein kinase n=1 Tax=Trichocoleus sp. DQ-U1 TaxID=2933926 RepID=UPI00329A7817
MVWAAGQMLHGGRYIVERVLGEGGYGITFLARGKKGNFVVIKTLNERVLTKREFTAYRDKFNRDFQKEALRLAVCRHPNIVQIDNAFSEGQLPCMAMEYVEGENLEQRVLNLGVLSETEALHYIRQIGDALTFIHDRGFLHRDVKPSNIMVRAEEFQAVLIDFGIAREFIPDITQTHTQTFTPGFAPIEQYAQQARRGEYTDVYALAATLYYLLTGEVPLPAPARAAGIRLNSPQRLNSSISNLANQAILKGMEFQAEERPQSVQEWLELLNLNKISTYSFKQPVSSNIPVSKTYNASSIATSRNFLTNRQNSASKIDYRQLQTFLALGKWQEADEETTTVMLKISSRETEGWLRVEDIKNFPMSDLRIINQLWIKHSKGRFGFSVQKYIWERIGGTRSANYEILCILGDRVGWRIDGAWVPYEEFIFDCDRAPAGHLPSGYVFCEVGWWVGLLNLFYRLE